MTTKSDHSRSASRRASSHFAGNCAGPLFRSLVVSPLLPLLLAGWPALEAAAQGNVQFSPRVDYTTGSLPISVAMADFDGDGKLDVAVANDGSNSVSVFRGDGTGGLGSRNGLSTDNGLHAVAAVDMNGVGRADLIVALVRGGRRLEPARPPGPGGLELRIQHRLHPVGVGVRRIRADGGLHDRRESPFACSRRRGWRRQARPRRPERWIELGVGVAGRRGRRIRPEDGFHDWGRSLFRGDRGPQPGWITRCGDDQPDPG